MRIKENHSVIVYVDDYNMELVKLKNEGIITNRKGIFLHKDIIGKEYGHKIYDTLYRNYIYVLKKSPELIASSLKRQTQILYEHDISFICLLANALPNKTIIEAGTGTGCLTYALASSVLPYGTIHTFEFNQERYLQVKKQYESFYNIKNNIIFYHKDIINYDFKEFKEGTIDSVVLDMPNPWLCIKKFHNLLKERGIIVIFLPCIEQVYKIVDALEENNFCEIITYELINKSWSVIQNKKRENGKMEVSQSVHTSTRKNNTVNNIVDNTVNNIVDNTVNNIVDNTVNNIVDNTVNNIIDKTVDNISVNAISNKTGDITVNNYNCNTIFSYNDLLIPPYRLFQKENKTHTGYLTVAKKQLNDEHEQMHIEEGSWN
ncbi:tRNA (adenine(58)-N(1))-methyltransferase catalytic subunit TRM61, putative [Hepatocystis sp. ex Piliocolobus tephrosceles]|nr:tRNA (adenine(58)-N(1))-methyltransferase catalytic subunit TRM61, putative [Hepatocystis sp. ex Piliocolobus tephrosceles]